MHVPILKQGPYLIASIQSELSDVELSEFKDELVQRVGATRSRGVVIDVSVWDVLDSFSCRVLRDLVNMIKLRGAEAVVVGIQPEVAFTMVQLGLSLNGVMTALDLEEGLTYLGQRKNGGHGRA